MAKRKQPKSIEIIELSSDSEADDVPQPSPPPMVAEDEPQTADPADEEEEDQPLLRIKGIRYNTKQSEEPPKPTQTGAPAPAKLPVRAKSTPGKDTGSSRHRHVSIEINLPTSSLRAAKGKAPTTEIPDSEEDKDEVSIYKTPRGRKHITFDDSDNDEYLTPMEHPTGSALELAPPKATDGAKSDLDAVEEEQEDEEDSDDEAPEAVSSHAANAQLAKSAQSAMNAAKQQAAEQKRKRQERDAFLKRQAGEKKKQKAAEKVIPDSEEERDAASPPPKSTLFPEKRKREIPKLLPLELLGSDDDASDDDQAGDKSAKRHKKLPRNGAAWIAEPKGPRDQKVGSTVYRVVDKRGDGGLAPKAKAEAVNLKIALMNRGRKTARPNKGFFVKRA
ncbi:hypothetical protein QBC39DRAFT_250921 [Podospora conica]|nr:hypothetical protein QBC39DRAFT_250921 [Schizothecium conicum]